MTNTNKLFMKYFRKQEKIVNEFFEDFKALDDDALKQINTLISYIKCTKTEKTSMYFTGIGKNEPIAEKTANMLRSLGFCAHFIDATNISHGDLGVLRKNDVVVAISKSGNTNELVHAIRTINSHNSAITIGVQLSQDDTLISHSATHSVRLPEVNEIDSWNKVPTMSNICLQLFFDMVSMQAASELEMTLHEFVHNHPGGMIGRTFDKND